MKKTLFIFGLMASLSFTALGQGSIDETIQHFTESIAKRDYKKAYSFCNKEAFGSYEQFKDQFDQVSELELMDMAMPAEESTEPTTVFASGSFVRNGETREGNFEFAMIKEKSWEIAGVSFTSDVTVADESDQPLIIDVAGEDDAVEVEAVDRVQAGEGSEEEAQPAEATEVQSDLPVEEAEQPRQRSGKRR